MIRLFRCLGARPAHRVDADLTARMFSADGCTCLAVNTHTIATMTRGDDLPVGYASAMRGLTPVLNVNPVKGSPWS
ncbi:hypothetical protein [Streptomyces longisporus]|uniref:Uncharacterized protein n=1 Tax=Streptomyces longisporus TaxID=1948 RepID=A0ABP5Z1Y0_STRLO